MDFLDESLTNKNHPSWPITTSGILIMGKRQGTKIQNKQLWGRVAMAAALWHSALEPKPFLLYVTSDVHGPANTLDAEIVKSLLVDRFGISADYVILRLFSNCTLLEVRAARVLRRAYKLNLVFVITHLYHAPRTQRYLDEVLSNAAVIPAHPDILHEMQFSMDYPQLFDDICRVVEQSVPNRLDRYREQIIEWCLTRAHTRDPRGRLERILAKILRPGT